MTKIDTPALIEGLRQVVKDYVDLDEYATEDDWGDATGAACLQDMLIYGLATAIIGVLDNPPVKP